MGRRPTRQAGTQRQQAAAYRDGLLMAFLTLIPIRRKNLAELAIGKTLVQVCDTWTLPFEGEAMNGDISGALWVSTDGSPMTQIALYDRIRVRTRAAFGHHVNPHAFRSAAATTWAIEDPATLRAASAHLGHRSTQALEQSYKMAMTLEAGRIFARTLERAANGEAEGADTPEDK